MDDIDDARWYDIDADGIIIMAIEEGDDDDPPFDDTPGVAIASAIVIVRLLRYDGTMLYVK
jgi:hypothetical protein